MPASANPVRILHLVWAPLGPGPLSEFLEALDRHPPGLDHELTFVLNGFAGRAEAKPWLDLLERHDVLFTPEPWQDLGAYGYAAAQVTEGRVCLMNSYARPLREGWLALLANALDRPGTAAVAATGSWESHASELTMRGRWQASPSVRDRLGGLYDWPRYRALFPRFPNPHLRTNGLLCDREMLVRALSRPAHTKEQAFVLESGRRGLSRAAQRGGGAIAVVGRDGQAYAPEQWPASRTFRSGEQENLLIADNRTEDWARASLAQRRELARRAWDPGSDLGSPAG